MCVGVMKPEDNLPRVGPFLQDLPGWWQASILPEPSFRLCVFFLSLLNVSQFYLKRSPWLQDTPIASLQLSNLLKMSIPFPVLWVRSMRTHPGISFTPSFRVAQCPRYKWEAMTHLGSWAAHNIRLNDLKLKCSPGMLFAFAVCLWSYYIFSLVKHSIQTPVLGWGWGGKDRTCMLTWRTSVLNTKTSFDWAHQRPMTTL